MSIDGLMDSVIAICRRPQGVSDSYGDVTIVPVFVRDSKAALSVTRSRMARDEGSGDMPTSTMVLLFPKNVDVLLSDIIYVRRGPMAGTWWVTNEPTQISRARHRETTLRPYVGDQPIL